MVLLSAALALRLVPPALPQVGVQPAGRVALISKPGGQGATLFKQPS